MSTVGSLLAAKSGVLSKESWPPLAARGLLPLAVSGRRWVVARPLLFLPWLKPVVDPKPVKSVIDEMLEGRMLTAFLAILTTDG
jgi:hypothetical protein